MFRLSFLCFRPSIRTAGDKERTVRDRTKQQQSSNRAAVERQQGSGKVAAEQQQRKGAKASSSKHQQTQQTQQTPRSFWQVRSISKLKEARASIAQIVYYSCARNSAAKIQYAQHR